MVITLRVTGHPLWVGTIIRSKRIRLVFIINISKIPAFTSRLNKNGSEKNYAVFEVHTRRSRELNLLREEK